MEMQRLHTEKLLHHAFAHGRIAQQHGAAHAANRLLMTSVHGSRSPNVSLVLRYCSAGVTAPAAQKQRSEQ